MAKEKSLKAEIESRVQLREALGAEIEALVDKLSEKMKALEDLDLTTYQILVEPDCLYHDSPISRAFNHEYLKQYMKKAGLSFIEAYTLDGLAAIKPFAERIKEASGWMLRFTKEKPKAKTGLDAIVKGA